MNRQGINELISWKSNIKRKPLVMQGVRQVGKTWLVKEFADTHYENFVYVNFEKTQRLRSLFEEDYDINRILSVLTIESSIPIKPHNTLIFFDEIQEATNGITSLKYFAEDAPHYHVIAAGSLLGVSLHKGISFPVGKVDFMTLYPFSFSEFLHAVNEQQLAELITTKPDTNLTFFHDKLTHFLRLYYFIGGMPEAIATYVQTNNLDEVRAIQNKILTGYENDFSKHAPKAIIPRVRMVWNSILAQLSKENKKYIFGQVAKGARAKDFEMAITWLNDAGLVHKVHLVSKPAIPLKSYSEMDAFKLYFTDMGLLLAFAEVDKSIVLDRNEILTEFKGAMTEQYVLQQLNCIGIKSLHYWRSDSGKAEVDFIIQQSKEIIPIEVKAEENLQAKSLKLYVDKYKPLQSIRTSMSKYRKEDWLVNLPLYAILSLKKGRED